VLQEISDYVNLWLPNDLIATVEMEGPSGAIYTTYEQIQVELIMDRYFEGLYSIAYLNVNRTSLLPDISINIEDPMWYRSLLDIVEECLQAETEEPVEDMKQYAREWLTETLNEYNGTVLHYAEKRYEDVSDGSYWRD
jgi:hypothetical protein